MRRKIVRRTESQRLAEFSLVVRQSTLKRLRAVPQGAENFRAVPDALSFAETAAHLIDADRWLLRKTEDESLEPLTGPVRRFDVESRGRFDRLVEELEHCGAERRALLAGLLEYHLQRPVVDSRFGGEVTLWWVIVRGNLDHEIHHRGQIAAWLRMV